jgi:hypothetical protein
VLKFSTLMTPALHPPQSTPAIFVCILHLRNP